MLWKTKWPYNAVENQYMQHLQQTIQGDAGCAKDVNSVTPRYRTSPLLIIFQ